MFTDCIPKLACRFGRRTKRADEVALYLAMTLGGEAGHRVAKQLCLKVSSDNLLRIARCSIPPERGAPRVVGVDDLAMLRGQTYGSIVLDLERHQPIALLPDRKWESFRDWLQHHPSVEVINRDRADCYARGAAAGAPSAKQVADRFHLLSNLREALKRTAERCTAGIRQAALAVAQWKKSQQVASSPPSDLSRTSPPADSSLRQATLGEVRRTKRVDLYQRIQQLKVDGNSQRSIARELGIDRATARRFFQAAEFPERACARRGKWSIPFLQEITKLWDEGCYNAKLLTTKIAALGYRGSYYPSRRLVAQWRGQGDDVSMEQRERGSLLPHSPSRIAWLLFLNRSNLDAQEERLTQSVQEHCPDLREATTHAREFVQIVKERKINDFDSWIDRACCVSSPMAIKRFAAGLKADKSPIEAALTLPWSNGQAEGQINRLKPIKRQMYGRANLDLLAQRFLWRQK
jgi:transposase